MLQSAECHGQTSGEQHQKAVEASAQQDARAAPLQKYDGTSKISMDGWWMVHTTVRPVSTVLRTVRMTMAAARASRPLVGSSINTIDGLATSSTAMVSRLRCSTLRPNWPARFAVLASEVTCCMRVQTGRLAVRHMSTDAGHMLAGGHGPSSCSLLQQLGCFALLCQR